MNEIIFLVEELLEGGFCARALGESIFTEADDLKRSAPEHSRSRAMPF